MQIDGQERPRLAGKNGDLDMNRLLPLSALAVIAVLGTGLGAVAQGPQDMGGMGGPMGGPGMGMGLAAEAWDTLDADANGTVTPEEFEAAARARFTAADTNADGNLSSEEMIAAAEARREEMRKAMEARMSAEMISRHDTNDDGQLSFEEMTPGDVGGRFFDRLDTDADGSVSRAEFDAAAQRMAGRGERGEHGGRGGHGEGRGWGFGFGRHGG
jgi:hypothetical protein